MQGEGKIRFMSIKQSEAKAAKTGHSEDDAGCPGFVRRGASGPGCLGFLRKGLYGPGCLGFLRKGLNDPGCPGFVRKILKGPGCLGLLVKDKMALAVWGFSERD